METRNKLNCKFAAITVSDTCSADPKKDRSGPVLVQLMQNLFQNAYVQYHIVPDEHDQIRELLTNLSDVPDMCLIITTGGTGFAPRDVTPEATKPLLTKECPQLTMAIAMASLQKTKFAALTRGVCGIRHRTLILNFPGSEKAVSECFVAIRELLPHAIDLIRNDLNLVKSLHEEISNSSNASLPKAMQQLQVQKHVHRCPHATKSGSNPDTDRNSPYPMIAVNLALEMILREVKPSTLLNETLKRILSPIDIPPFRASIKDGYALKSGFSGTKRVLGTIFAGDKINEDEIKEDECFKINTGAPVPKQADCIVQIEDTKVVSRTKHGAEEYVEILVQPVAGLDIRAIGHDLAKNEQLFPSTDHSPVVLRSILAAVGNVNTTIEKPRIAIISSGNELMNPEQLAKPFKIYDSNTIMLKELVKYFGFDCAKTALIEDDSTIVERTIQNLFEEVDFIICTGGVSMGDKDYIKQSLGMLGFDLHIGRVNMKPGKPFTFACKNQKYFFGLPGNPVSAFVTFHLFVLPALRWHSGWKLEKCSLPCIMVKLQNDSLELDSRPEYARATVTSKMGTLHALVNGDQISSRLQSICGADVLIHLPPSSAEKKVVKEGETLKASVLRMDFITNYE